MISEDKLNTWAIQGSVAQSSSTYNGIKETLESPRAPYSGKSFEVFLQGSYGNSTNIQTDSDVDIVIKLESTFYYDTSDVPVDRRQSITSSISPATYDISDFRREVLSWLSENYGGAVSDGNKAIAIAGSGNRRDADVLVCADHRDYFINSSGLPTYHEGIAFWPKTGGKVVNYPKQHRANCTSKHQSTSHRFKPVVRILKNYRNDLTDRFRLGRNKAPSYFLEGLLYNVSGNRFHYTYQQTMNSFVEWLRDVPAHGLVCANEIHALVRSGHSVCWDSDDFEEYRRAIIQDW